MPTEQTDFFFRLYEIIEGNRLLVMNHLDDLFLKERFDMVNFRASTLQKQNNEGFYGFPVMAYLRKLD